MKIIDLNEVSGKRFWTERGLTRYLRRLGIEENIVYDKGSAYLDPSGQAKYLEDRQPVAVKDGMRWELTDDEDAFHGVNIGISTGSQLFVAHADIRAGVKLEPIPRKIFKMVGGDGFVIVDDRIRGDMFFDSYFDMWRQATGRQIHPDNPQAFGYKDLDDFLAELSKITGKRVVKNNFKSEDSEVLHFPGSGSTRGYEIRADGIAVGLKWLLYCYDHQTEIYDALVTRLRNRFDRLPPNPRRTRSEILSFFLDSGGIYTAEYVVQPHHPILGQRPNKFSLKLEVTKETRVPDVYEDLPDQLRPKPEWESLGTLYVDYKRRAALMALANGISEDEMQILETIDPIFMTDVVTGFGPPPCGEELLVNEKRFNEDGVSFVIGSVNHEDGSLNHLWAIAAGHEQFAGRRLMGLID